MGVRYVDADDLGQHGYRSGSRENNGIAYTCHGGHIDVTHLRKIADWTAYLAYQSREALLKDETEFRFKMFEPSQHYVRLEYPPGWKFLGPDMKHDIASEISACLGEYLAYTNSVWHEILTWHGFKAIGFYPEYNSAFSWEDNYSNALGSLIGGLAVRDSDHAYNEAVTLLVDEAMGRLGPQSKKTAKAAGEAVRGSWFVGGFIRVTMVKRHLDVGLDDGQITPWLVPNVSGCEAPGPQPCPVPNLSLLREYGFHVTHEIKPREWEKHKILRAVYPDRKNRKDRIEPAKHFGVLMAHVQTVVNKRYGPYAHLYEAPSPESRPSPVARASDRRTVPSDTRVSKLSMRLAEVTRDSSPYDPAREAAIHVEAGPSEAPEARSRGFFGFLGSAVSWLAEGAL